MYLWGDFVNIQVLTGNQKDEKFAGDGVVINSLHDAQSLDEFEVNIFNLNDVDIWKNNNVDRASINIISDFISLSLMIENSKRTKIIILLPQNIHYHYCYMHGSYRQSSELKDMLDFLYGILRKLTPCLDSTRLVYENTKTNVAGKKVSAAFFFNVSEEIALLKSEKSQKPTTVILSDNIIASTLDIQHYDEVIGLLTELQIIRTKQSVPPWLKEIDMFDDSQQLEIIDENNQVIEAAKDNISKAKEKINKNNEYKSILYTTGDELVKVVFEILETMLGCDLSQFEDKKKEDFLFEIGDMVFIGEIKGVNHNVKNENVSQLDVHYQGYLDEHADKDEEQIKSILIMNHQKNKPLKDREPVHERQINLAYRNKSLIVETITLLKLFEKYISKDMSREECIALLSSESGLLKL